MAPMRKRSVSALFALLAVLPLTCTNWLASVKLDGAHLAAFMNFGPQPPVEDVPVTRATRVPSSQAARFSNTRSIQGATAQHGLQHWLAVMAVSLGVILSVTMSSEPAHADGYQFRQ
eukprot:3714090-Amphidinium_carterae.1